ncbi:hypothetical protein BW727_100436 [Jeotgalibaca dankookensis]|uniref:Uncharacterized protein n=1 Tax=Jeotgalibaca dankookensis TaxID=708126 RepID=A0A1S6IMT0_9LACT|nr:hypothetical protein BW727_100436 [Jeotgalibaca dankookensis]
MKTSYIFYLIKKQREIKNRNVVFFISIEF